MSVTHNIGCDVMLFVLFFLFFFKLKLSKQIVHFNLKFCLYSMHGQYFEHMHGMKQQYLAQCISLLGTVKVNLHFNISLISKIIIVCFVFYVKPFCLTWEYTIPYTSVF